MRQAAAAFLRMAVPACCAALLLSACSQDDGFTDSGDPIAVNFNAGITATRTTGGGDRWAANDKVGIFMVSAGGMLPGGIVSDADNREYNVTTPATGELSPANGTPIYYPRSGNVDFIAYYPHGEKGTGAGKVTDYTYNLSVADQSDPAAIDVLYAKAANQSRGKTAVSLSFSHVLSKVTFNVANGTGMAAQDVANLTSGDVTLGGILLTATLALQDGTLTPGVKGDIHPAKAATTGYQATFSAVIIPQAGMGRTLKFRINTSEYTWNIPDNEVFKAGDNYIYPVTINETGIEVGTPAIAPWTVNDNGSGTTEELGKGIEKVFIHAGTFLMGSPDNEPNRESDETQHFVTLTQDFYMGKYAITVAQYAAFLNAKGITGQNSGHDYNVSGDVDGHGKQDLFLENEWWTPSWKNGKWESQPGMENKPMINVTWYGAKAYADWAGGSLPP